MKLCHTNLNVKGYVSKLLILHLLFLNKSFVLLVLDLMKQVPWIRSRMKKRNLCKFLQRVSILNNTTNTFNKQIYEMG